jgi:probable HAF family extracellular repeat protein
MICTRFVFTTALCIFASGAAANAAPPTFQGLGDLPGGLFLSRAISISGDGSTVVGSSESNIASQAFRWTSSGGMTNLGALPGADASYSQATSASFDGTVVVGNSDSGNSGNSTEAFRWTTSTGMTGLGDLPGGLFSSKSFDVSADGSVVVGVGTATLDQAFRWTQSLGMQGLGDLPGGDNFSVGRGVSGNGNIVVGLSSSAASKASSLTGVEAFRWTAGTGMQALGDLPGGLYYSVAVGISADGNVIVGRSDTTVGFEAFRWTQAGGLQGLGDLPGALFFSAAQDASGNGSVIVGQSESASGQDAFIWNQAQGMRSIYNMLTIDYGLNLTGWTLTDATAISDDGLVIIGDGINPSGNLEAWLVDLRPIPEPCSGVMLAAGLLGLISWRRRERQRRRA